ncbi:hypothetical protein AAIO65_04685 [Erwinia amylovora]|uniref:hypothetical protein n=2 Tax=Erwinia amylovora TaxID=552 RepID=UPI0035C6F99B
MSRRLSPNLKSRRARQRSQRRYSSWGEAVGGKKRMRISLQGWMTRSPTSNRCWVHQPGLPDRPTVMANGHARIGRPPQQVPEILIAPAPL